MLQQKYPRLILKQTTQTLDRGDRLLLCEQPSLELYQLGTQHHPDGEITWVDKVHHARCDVMEQALLAFPGQFVEIFRDNDAKRTTFERLTLEIVEEVPPFHERVMREVPSSEWASQYAKFIQGQDPKRKVHLRAVREIRIEEDVEI